MAKIKVSADTILSILQGIMNDEDINYTINDVSAPEDWKGKTVQEALNVKYYTFKHRPFDTEKVIAKILDQEGGVSIFTSLNRAFCLLSLSSTDRVFSNKIDNVTVSANLEYWVQTDKVKLLEDMFEDIAIETNGIRVPVQIGSEERQVLIAVGALNIGELEDTTEFGEMSVCEITIEFVFYENAVSMTDYIAEFEISKDGESQWVPVPISSLEFDIVMNQQTVPRYNNVKNIGSINLSKIKSISITFYGYINAFIDDLTENSFIGDVDENGMEISDNNDNNRALLLRITRKDKQFIYKCVIKEHKVTIREDISNEAHCLVLTTRGIKDGVA